MRNRVSDFNRIPSEQVIQTWICGVIEIYGQKVGAITPPICEKSLCEAVEELKGVKIKCQPSKKASVFEEGLLIPVRRGFIIQYRVLDGRGRPFANVKIRETICHELAHILFYDCDSSIPRLGMTPPEHVCHSIARQLLIPDTLLRRRWTEQVEPDVSLTGLLREFSSKFRVALRVMAQRLTEDLSLLENTMITFWKYQNERNNWSIFVDQDEQIDWEDFHVDHRLCADLKKLLPRYWRNRIHREVWDKVVSKVVVQGEAICQPSLHVHGERRKEGKIKSILFNVECEPWDDFSNQLKFEWKDQKRRIYNVISLEKFDLHTLQNGM